MTCEQRRTFLDVVRRKLGLTLLRPGTRADEREAKLATANTLI